MAVGFGARPEKGWGWIVVAGVLTVLAGIVIAVGWPVTWHVPRRRPYVPGLVVHRLRAGASRASLTDAHASTVASCFLLAGGAGRIIGFVLLSVRFEAPFVLLSVRFEAPHPRWLERHVAKS